MHNLHTENSSCTTSQHKLEIRISQLPSRNSFFSSATQVKPCRAGSGIGKFRIPRRPWDEHDCEANAGQLLYKNKNIGNLLRSRWKMIEISKKVRSQSLNFTIKPKGYLLQTTKLWEKLIVLNGRRKKGTKPQEEVNFLSLKRVKFVKMTIFYSL